MTLKHSYSESNEIAKANKIEYPLTPFETRAQIEKHSTIKLMAKKPQENISIKYDPSSIDLAHAFSRINQFSSSTFLILMI